MECINNNGITQPDNTPITCPLGYSSDECIIHANAISYLSLPTNSTQKDINLALLSSLMDARTRIATLESIVEGLTE